MEGIIWIVVIIIIIGNVLKQQSEKKIRDMRNGMPGSGGSSRNTAAQPPVANMPNQSRGSNPNVPNQGHTIRPNVPSQNRSAQPNVSNQSRSMQSNVQNGKPAAGNHTYGSSTRQNDILSRANTNAEGRDRGQLEKSKQNMSSGLAVENGFTEMMDLARVSENMSHVNDLILMGYQSELTFERDFVSEGVEMLNSFANDQEA